MIPLDCKEESAVSIFSLCTQKVKAFESVLADASVGRQKTTEEADEQQKQKRVTSTNTEVESYIARVMHHRGWGRFL